MNTMKASSAPMDDEDLVTITILPSHVAVMNPPVPDVKSLLYHRVKTFTVGGPTGIQLVEEDQWECAYRFERLLFDAGMVPRAQDLLEEHGYVVQIDDHRDDTPRPHLDQDNYDAASEKERRFLDAVVANRLGQIEVQNEEDMLEKCALLCEAFPEARFVMAVATRKQAWWISRKLQRRLKRAVRLYSARAAPQRNARLVVGTFTTIRAYAPGQWDEFLLLPYAEDTGALAYDVISRLNVRRRLAFFRPQRRMDRAVGRRLEQLCGLVIHRVMQPRVPVRVVMALTPKCAISAGAAGLVRKQNCYWHNDIRNHCIADVATAVITVDEQRLRQLGLKGKRLERLCARRGELRIVIVVESPDHAEALERLLPGWKVRSGIPIKRKVASKKKKAGNDEYAPRIVTIVYAAKRRIRADVIIRATGTEWPLHLKEFPPRCDSTDVQEIFLFDFLDAFDATAKEETKRRLKAYERSGMKVIVAP